MNTRHCSSHGCHPRRPGFQPENWRERARLRGQVARHVIADMSTWAERWAEPKAEAAVEWLTPRARAAWQAGVQAAAPRVEEAARLLSPKIDVARDKLKDQVLPAIVEAVNHAAEVAAASASQGGAVPAMVAPVPAPKKTHRVRTFLCLSALAGVIGGVIYAIWSRREESVDPWSEDDTWGEDAVAFTPTTQAAPEVDPESDGPRPEATKDSLGDLADAAGAAADTVGEIAGEAVRKVSHAGKRAAAAAQTAISKAKKAASGADGDAEAQGESEGGTDGEAGPAS